MIISHSHIYGVNVYGILAALGEQLFMETVGFSRKECLTAPSVKIESNWTFQFTKKGVW